MMTQTRSLTTLTLRISGILLISGLLLLMGFPVSPANAQSPLVSQDKSESIINFLNLTTSPLQDDDDDDEEDEDEDEEEVDERLLWDQEPIFFDENGNVVEDGDFVRGLISTFYDNLEAGVFVGDDFSIPEPKEIQEINVFGFTLNQTLAEDYNSVVIYIYEDDEGVPSGHPMDAPEDATHVWSLEFDIMVNGSLNPALDPDGIEDGFLLIDLREIDETVILPQGTYWLSVHVTTDENIPDPENDTEFGNRWNWIMGVQTDLQSQIIDPDVLFEGGSPEWIETSVIVSNWQDFAFQIYGEDAELNPLPFSLLSPEAGSEFILVTGEDFPIVFEWEISALAQTYIWYLTFPGDDIEDAVFDLDSNSSGTAPDLNLTSETLNAILRGLGFTEAQPINLEWTVLAIREDMTTLAEESFPITFFLETDVSVQDDPETVQALELHQNYPNPFNPSTNISFSLPADDTVSLQVFDLQGRLIATLVDGHKSAGRHTISFNASGLSSGMYLYRLTSSDQSLTKRFLLVR